jgi:hypothetical protein
MEIPELYLNDFGKRREKSIGSMKGGKHMHKVGRFELSTISNACNFLMSFSGFHQHVN